MEVKLLKLQENNDVDGLHEYINGLEIDSICFELNNICMKENGAFILQILLNGLSDSSSCQEKRMKISKTVLHNIEKKIISPRLTEKIVSVLATQMVSFSAPNIMILIDSCLAMMRESSEQDGCDCWKDFLPKLLNKIIEEDFIEHNGSQIQGLEYKNEVVISILHFDWPDSIVTNIASMFIDMPLTLDEHLKVVNKLCKIISSMNLSEIPPLVHQMLQLTKEQHFMPLFLTLSKIFDEKLYANLSKEQAKNNNVNSLKEIQTIEGTVLYHIFATVSSLGPQSIHDFVKTVKDCVASPSFILGPFSVTFLLTISCVSYVFEEDLLNLIKGAILRNYTEEEKISDSAWIETVVPSAVVVDELFDKIIQNCFKERDKVMKGLINLGFSLLATQKTRGKESQCDKIWNLGSSILVRLLIKYGNVASCVLQTLANQISQAHESIQYTDCLFHMVRKTPLNVLDSSVVLIQLLDNICGRLPGNVGKRVVKLILPLTKMSQSLRDNLIIVLRKSLFPQDKLCREMAVTGIVLLLKDLKISNLRNLSQSISQPYCSLTQIYSEPSEGQDPSHSNEGVCLELLSMLREVFKHQEEVKILFYRGIYESVYFNPELGCHALDYLKTQLDKFFKPEDLPPLDFDKTVTLRGATPIVLEPIAELVLSVGLIVAKIEEGNTRSSKLREMFDSLCERMSNSDVPHFILGKIFDGSPESLAKEEEIRQILGVYEALMGYILSTWTKDSTSHGEMLNSLFRGYCRLSDYVRSLGKPDKRKPEEKTKSSKNEELGDKGKKKDKSKCAPFRFPSPVLNYKCACRLLTILYESSIPWASEQSVVIIKNKRELHRYCFNVILLLIKQAQSIPTFELSKNNATLGYLTKIGRIIFTKCIKRIGDLKVFDLQTTVTSVESFCELIHLTLVNFKGKFPNFLNELNTKENSVHIQLKNMLDVILGELKNVLKDDLEEDGKEEEALSRKLCLVLITTAGHLISQLPRGPELQQILDELKCICKEIKVESPNVAKALLSLLLNTHVKCKPSGSLLLDLALCLCYNMTLIDDEMEVKDHTVYAVINKKSANACIVSICDTLRFLINQIEWLVARPIVLHRLLDFIQKDLLQVPSSPRKDSKCKEEGLKFWKRVRLVPLDDLLNELKAELLILSLHKSSLETKLEDINERERELCRHVNFVMKVLSVLCTIAVPPGIYADAILKEIGNFYNKLTLVTKYFILKVGKYHQQLQSSKFDKTVKMVDHELSKNMYCFTEHVISDGATGVEDKLKKQKDPTALKNKCLRETKIIPKVIYEREQFQKFILQLSNKSKINLAGQTKHTMARDYRLYTKEVKKILEEENVHEDMEIEVSPACNDEPEERSAKRLKLSD